MNLALFLLYPLALLIPADAGGAGGTGVEGAARQGQVVEAGASNASGFTPDTASADAGPVQWPDPILAFRTIEPDSADQIRIEQRMTIRIAPRGAARTMPDAFVGLPGEPLAPRFIERKIGKCVNVGAIAGVQPQGGNRLLLFMRNGAMVSAELDRACRARDFYSGFYLANSTDGNLCVDRDQLLTRSGTNCTLTQIRQLIEDRR